MPESVEVRLDRIEGFLRAIAYRLEMHYGRQETENGWIPNGASTRRPARPELFVVETED